MKENMIIILLILSLLSSSFCDFKELPKYGEIKVIPDTKVYLDLSSFKIGDSISIDIKIDLYFSESKYEYSFDINQVPASSWNNSEFWRYLKEVTKKDMECELGNCILNWKEKKKREAIIFLLFLLPHIQNFINHGIIK